MQEDRDGVPSRPTRENRSCIALAVTLATTLSAPACAVTLCLSHSYGEFVDRGVVHAQVGVASGARLDCAEGVTRERAGARVPPAARSATR